MTFNRLTLAAVLLGTMAVPALAQPARHHVRHVSASAHRVSMNTPVTTAAPTVTTATPAVTTAAPAVTTAMPVTGKAPLAAANTATTPAFGKSAIVAPASASAPVSPIGGSPRVTTLPQASAATMLAAPKVN